MFSNIISFPFITEYFFANFAVFLDGLLVEFPTTVFTLDQVAYFTVLFGLTWWSKCPSLVRWRLFILTHSGWGLLLSLGWRFASLGHLFLWNLMFILMQRTILDGWFVTEWVFTLIRLGSAIVGTLVHIQIYRVRLISTSSDISSRDLSSFRLIFLLLTHGDLSPLLCPSIQNNVVGVFNWVTSVLVGMIRLKNFPIILVCLLILNVFIKLLTAWWLLPMLKLLSRLILQVLLSVTSWFRLFHGAICLTIESGVVLHITGR